MKKIFRHFMVMMGVGLWVILGGGSSHSQNLPPVFDPVGTCYVNEGDTLNINLFATDPDGDILKIWVLGSSPNVVFSDDGEGHANFCWVPEFIGPHSSSGSPFELLFFASDGSLATQMEVKVNVVNVNRPPQLILPDSFSVGAATELVFQVRAEDPDKERVRIGVVDLPGGADLDEEGIFSWTPGLADTGEHRVIFEAIDLSGGNDLKEAHIRVISSSPYVLSIGIIEALVGGKVQIPINLNNPDTVSGMELLVRYDPTIYTFLGLTKDSTRVSEWEYYVCRERSEGLFELIKIVGIADFPNELSTSPLFPGDGPLTYLNFEITSNTQYAGLLIPLEFYHFHFDFTDNTLSTFSGEFISRDKINFGNGGVLLKAGNILLGDINLNGIPFDVGDPVVLARHLVYGIPLSQQQLLNSDVNQDGHWATLADLVYIIMRIQEEGSPPYVEPDPKAQVVKAIISDEPTGLQGHESIMSFSIGSDSEVGGVLFVFKGIDLNSENVQLSPEIQDMELYTRQDGDELKVMIISTEGKYIQAGDRSLFTIEGEGTLDSVEISISDSEGNLVGVKTIYEQRSTLPRAYSLSQNYPNPFNPVTRIQYSVGRGQTEAADNSAQEVTLKVYNVLGRLVKILVDEEKLPGTYQVVWDGRDENKEEVSSGIYFYRLKASDYVEAKKMILLK
jgi:hypothetical protein